MTEFTHTPPHFPTNTHIGLDDAHGLYTPPPGPRFRVDYRELKKPVPNPEALARELHNWRRSKKGKEIMAELARRTDALLLWGDPTILSTHWVYGLSQYGWFRCYPNAVIFGGPEFKRMGAAEMAKFLSDEGFSPYGPDGGAAYARQFLDDLDLNASHIRDAIWDYDMSDKGASDYRTLARRKLREAFSRRKKR